MLIGIYFLDVVQVRMNAGIVIINALKPISEDKEIRAN